MPNTHTTVALTNPKSPTNVGSVLRAAGCFGVNEVHYTGNRFDVAKKFYTDTKDANNKIPLLRVESFIESKQENAKVVCVELVEGATPLPEFVHPENAIYIFGPEDGSLSQEVVTQADEVVYIPTIGCLNLAATVNVLLYDRSSKQRNIERSDALIKQSRDRNNATKV